MIHAVDSKLLSNQVNVLVVGAGGNGSHVLSGLVDLHLAMVALGHPGGLHVSVIDDDLVSESNIGRQRFMPADVGMPKASVLVNRINMTYGFEWVAQVERLSNNHSNIRSDIVIGCVDNRKARQAIVNKCKGSYYLDLGNRQDDGQVVLGQIPSLYSSMRYNDPSRLPHVGDLFPDIINPELEDDDSGPSCSLAEALEKQSLFINKSVADYALNILSQMFKHGQISYHGGFINLKSGRTTPLVIDPDVWKRFGYKVFKPRKKK